MSEDREDRAARSADDREPILKIRCRCGGVVGEIYQTSEGLAAFVTSLMQVNGQAEFVKTLRRNGGWARLGPAVTISTEGFVPRWTLQHVQFADTRAPFLYRCPHCDRLEAAFVVPWHTVADLLRRGRTTIHV